MAVVVSKKISNARIFLGVAGLFFCLNLTGCFIRIPTKSNEEMNRDVGRFGVMTRDFILVSYYMSKAVWELEDERYLGPKQHVIRTLKNGTKIKIKGVGYRRLPHGVFYVYVCEDIEHKDEFEIDQNKFDAIRLSARPVKKTGKKDAKQESRPN